jgi:tRNA dimethylallyltransferase
MPPRAALYERIDQRVQEMLDQGWLEEVKRLIASGILADAKPFQFIGYSQLRALLAGEMNLGQAVATIQQAARRYAKRQMTWFRKEPGVQWFAGFGGDPEVAGNVLSYVTEQLAAAPFLRAHPIQGV